MKFLNILLSPVMVLLFIQFYYTFDTAIDDDVVEDVNAPSAMEPIEMEGSNFFVQLYIYLDIIMGYLFVDLPIHEEWFEIPTDVIEQENEGISTLFLF